MSVVLMTVQATANTGRLVLLYPILTRVVAPEHAGPAPGNGKTDEERQAREALETVRHGADSGGLEGFLEGITDGVNRITAPLIPQSWLDAATPEGDDSRETSAIRAQRLDQFATLLSVLLLFVLFIIVMCTAAYGETYVAESVRLHILMDVREAVFRKLLDQPVGFYDTKRRGELVQRVLGDVEGYAWALRTVMDGVIRGVLHIVTTLVLLVFLSWQLSLVCMLGLPFLLPMRTLMRRVLRRSHKRQQKTEKRVEVLLQIFSGIRTVKAYGTEERRVKEFRSADEVVTHQGLKVQRAKSSADALTAFINNFLAMVLGVGGGFMILMRPDIVNWSILVLFLVLVANLYQPLKRIVRQFTLLQDAMASVERTTEYLAMPPGSPDTSDAVAFPGVEETVRFENVSFGYVEGTPVLTDVSFEIPKGATVALVGPSGGGKSTLCDLLLRFYDPDTGRITVDGKDVRSFQRSTLLAKTAVVTQDPFLFHTSISDNIRQGRFDATDEDIRAAAQAAQIHEYVRDLPRGYDMEVGEAGVRLSGGQRQRITIARALVRDPEILILDEATSSLDTHSERDVQAALQRLQRGRTTLVVAHRLSTVRHADRIVVIATGRVVDQGTHTELLARGGLYSQLVQMQDLRADPD